MKLSNKTYDVLKWIALYFLPAIGTLYFTLSGIWNFPYGEQVVGTITALDTFIAVIIGISKYNYKGDGTLFVGQSNGELEMSKLDIDTPIDVIADKKTIVINVEKQ